MDCPFFNALSPIHGGRGLFSNKYFPAGTILFKVIDETGKLTIRGKLMNNSLKSNVALQKGKDGSWYAVSTVPIFQGKEVLAPACPGDLFIYWEE